MTAWDYMYKSEFKARAELSAESELVLEVELPPTASDERCEDRDQDPSRIGFAIVLLRSAAHSTDVLSSFSAYPHISRPIRLVLSPVAELCKLVTVRRMHLKLVFSSRNRTGVHLLCGDE